MTKRPFDFFLFEFTGVESARAQHRVRGLDA